MKPQILCSFVLLCFVSCSWLQGHGQIDPRLQTVNLHFVGVWVGKNDAYIKSPTVTTPVRIAITNDPKKGRLRLEYTYGTKGQKSYDHSVRFIVIDPIKSTVTLNWQHNSKEVYKAAGLEKFLDAGYGDFGFSGTQTENGLNVIYRATFELNADDLYYRWEKSTNGVDFSITGEWTLSRESGTKP